MELISIAAGTVGAEFLKEAVKFLWSEAGKILERYHKRREKAEEANAVVEEPAPARLELPARRVIRFDVVERRRAELETSMRDLLMYAQGIQPMSASDATLLEKADELQRLVVESYGIDAPELMVRGTVKAKSVEKGGEAIGVDAEIDHGAVDGKVDVDGPIRGKATGAKVKTH